MPGGQDTNPDPGAYSELYQFIDPIINDGVDQDTAKNGVDIIVQARPGSLTQEPYPNIAVGYVIKGSWGGEFVQSAPITQAQIDDPDNDPIIIHVTEAIILKAGDSGPDGLAVTFMITNLVKNVSEDWCEETRKWGSTAAMKVANSTLDGNVKITANSTANLSFDQGRMTGDVLVEDGSSANVTLQNRSVFTGRLDKVDGVTINSQSNWNMTGNDSIGTLAMNGGGTVTFGAQDVPGTFYQLNVGTLASAGDQAGIFAMKGNFTTGEHDFLNVTGVATGNFGLLVSASGTDAASPQQLHMVHTAAGDAQFSLVGGPVDVGTWSYDLINRPGGSGANDRYLGLTTKTISPGAPVRYWRYSTRHRRS